jgi:predicted nucleotidyltransferase
MLAERHVLTLVWFNNQQSLLGLIRMERELSMLVGVKVDLLTEQAISPYLIDRIKKELRVIPQ